MSMPVSSVPEPNLKVTPRIEIHSNSLPKEHFSKAGENNAAETKLTVDKLGDVLTNKVITPILVTPPSQGITTIQPTKLVNSGSTNRSAVIVDSRSVSHDTSSPASINTVPIINSGQVSQNQHISQNPQNLQNSNPNQPTNLHNTSLTINPNATANFHAQSSSFGQWNNRETLGLLQWCFSNLRGSPYIMESFEGAAQTLRFVGKCAHRENFYNSKNCCMRFIQMIDDLPEKLKSILISVCGTCSGRVLSSESITDKCKAYHAPTTAVIMKMSPTIEGVNSLKQNISIQQNDRKQCAVHFQLFTKLIKHFARIRKNEILKELEEQEEQFSKYERLMYKLKHNQLTEEEIVNLKTEMVKDMKTRGSQLHKMAQDANITVSSPPLVHVSNSQNLVSSQNLVTGQNLVSGSNIVAAANMISNSSIMSDSHSIVSGGSIVQNNHQFLKQDQGLRHDLIKQESNSSHASLQMQPIISKQTHHLQQTKSVSKSQPNTIQIPQQIQKISQANHHISPNMHVIGQLNTSNGNLREDGKSDENDSKIGANQVMTTSALTHSSQASPRSTTTYTDNQGRIYHTIPASQIVNGAQFLQNANIIQTSNNNNNNNLPVENGKSKKIVPSNNGNPQVNTTQSHHLHHQQQQQQRMYVQGPNQHHAMNPNRHQQHPGTHQVVMMNQNGQFIQTSRMPANMVPTTMVAGTPTSRFLSPAMTYVRPNNQGSRRVSASSIPTNALSTGPPPMKKNKLEE